MKTLTNPDTVWIDHRVFPSWSIQLPRHLADGTVIGDAAMPYWHTRDDHRSVSLTSVVLTHRVSAAPVAAADIAAQCGVVIPPGEPVDARPDGLRGHAVIADADPDAVAGRALMGMLVHDGILLLATITSDDEAWCRRVWASIRHHPRPRVDGLGPYQRPRRGSRGRR